MKYRFILIASLFFLVQSLFAEDSRITINLNGEWSFDQTINAFPPSKYTRKIPVPGLVHLATPKIEGYEKLFRNNILASDGDYIPKYSWYKRNINIDETLKGRTILIDIKKSQFVTSVFINGKFAGTALECYTPIKFDITNYIEYGKDNEILICVGDRKYLPGQTAGSQDKEKVRYLSGIWDDVSIIAIAGKLEVDKVLFLPSLKEKQVLAKVLVWNHKLSQQADYLPKSDSCFLNIKIYEKKSNQLVAEKRIGALCMRDKKTIVETNLNIPDPQPWSPESPFLYRGEVEIESDSIKADLYTDTFGIRDFNVNGRSFNLNGEKYYLRGSNITLHRFFEDPECENLPWDREWVKKMLITQPKAIDWNAMRICVGIAPDFWYDLCDEYGIVLQNEWMYWQNRGWDDQIRKEYTDWVWSDGNHPSIVIWDAINENWDNYIGNSLIPELRKLDPTRVWDAGYMSSDQGQDQMDEPHTYRALVYRLDSATVAKQFSKNIYNIGDLDYWDDYGYVLTAGVPQLVNEYGWIWLWRDGRPSDLTVENFRYYVGGNATTEQRRAFQAYLLQYETEWLRCERSLAGVLAFCLLTNNYGFTGDLFVGPIKDLNPSLAYKWYKHCFSKEAVFVNLVDGRYTKHILPYNPGQVISFNLVGVNDCYEVSKGELSVNIYDSAGNKVYTSKSCIEIPAMYKKQFPVSLTLPNVPGGYLITSEYKPEDKDDTFISRRFIKVGKCDKYNYYDIQP